jgi:integration host factor beta subunit
MTKAELITRTAKDASLTRRQAEQAVEAFLAQIQAALSRGEPVTLVGFGSFSVQTRAARKGRNPRTGQDLVIAARKVPKFSPGKQLREAVTSPSQG